MRTTADLVKELMLPGKHYDTSRSPSLDPFLATANAVVDQVAACGVRKGKAYTAAQLELMERWLTAHFYCMSDRLAANETTADANATFVGQTAMALDSTQYGQSAMMLDFAGCLKSIGRGNNVSFGWLGKPPSQQIPFYNRD